MIITIIQHYHNCDCNHAEIDDNEMIITIITEGVRGRGGFA
jgi:hypothetical protein